MTDLSRNTSSSIPSVTPKHTHGEGMSGATDRSPIEWIQIRLIRTESRATNNGRQGPKAGGQEPTTNGSRASSPVGGPHHASQTKRWASKTRYPDLPGSTLTNGRLLEVRSVPNHRLDSEMAPPRRRPHTCIDGTPLHRQHMGA